MKAIDKLKEFLGQSPTVYTSRLDVFLPIDTKAVAKRLDLEVKAKDRGSRNEPATTANSFDDVEHEIILFVHGERSNCQSYLTSEIATFDDRLARLQLEYQAAVLMDAEREATAEFTAQVNQGKDDLAQARRDVIEHERHLISFRKRNGIDRPAVYPQSTLLRWGLIAMLLLIEAIANGYFFAKGSDFGLLGGVMQAVMVAAVNIFSALMFSRTLLRWIWHQGTIWKTVGTVTLLIYVAFMVSFNLFVAHYREALALDGTGVDPATTAVQTFLESPLGLTGFESWILVFVGLLFGILSMIDGYTMDDPYPQYGDVDREYRRRLKDYVDLKATLIDSLRQVRDDASSTMRELRETLSKKRGEYDAVLAGRRRTIEHFKEHLNHLEVVGLALLSTYRIENKKYRTMPAPAHFDETWVLARPRDPDPPTTRAPSDLDQLVASASAAAIRASEALHASFQDAVTKYDQIDEIVREAHSSG
jgi:hypothetical protein